jgi:hypothetical protein
VPLIKARFSLIFDCNHCLSFAMVCAALFARCLLARGG